ncbi:MAG: pilus assembly protein PilP [Proteobacteria bacterium]|nr:MAG: pilus assembly protein PilP [Pseudomonadota bacterium]
MRLGAVALVALLCVALSGCGSDGMDDLRDWVIKERKGRKPRVEPLPEIRTQESFVYEADTLADPFAPFNLKPQGGVAGGPSPDINRRKEPLEDYPLDALRMVGTLSRGNQSWAIIQAPDGIVYRVKNGDHMGQNFGMVTDITEENVKLVELIQNPLSDWIEREAKLAILE